MRSRASHERPEGEDRVEWLRFGKFFLIAVAGFVLDTALLNALVLGAGLDTTLRSVGAKAISATAAGLLNFVMHRYWTFRDRTAPFFRELVRYAMVRGAAIGLGVFLFGWFRHGFQMLLARHARPGLAIAWSANLAQIATSMIVLVFSYVLHKRFTFRGDQDARR